MGNSQEKVFVPGSRKFGNWRILHGISSRCDDGKFGKVEWDYLKTSKGKTRGFGRLFWILPDTSQQFKILSCAQAAKANTPHELVLIWAELAL